MSVVFLVHPLKHIYIPKKLNNIKGKLSAHNSQYSKVVAATASASAIIFSIHSVSTTLRIILYYCLAHIQFQHQQQQRNETEWMWAAAAAALYTLT